MWDVFYGMTKSAWDVMYGMTKVLSRVANLCGMFCPRWQKMAWDVLSPDVLSGSLLLDKFHKIVLGYVCDKVSYGNL